MEYITLFNGDKIEKNFFEARLKELKNEVWKLKNISELGSEHINCELTFSTISPLTCDCYYESNNYSMITKEAYQNYIKE
jgi:hypothetical protein